MGQTIEFASYVYKMIAWFLLTILSEQCKAIYLFQSKFCILVSSFQI